VLIGSSRDISEDSGGVLGWMMEVILRIRPWPYQWVVVVIFGSGCSILVVGIECFVVVRRRRRGGLKVCIWRHVTLRRVNLMFDLR
jgi:hypothetical protein